MKGARATSGAMEATQATTGDMPVRLATPLTIDRAVSPIRSRDGIHVEAVESVQELERLRSPWQALAEAAVEPNVFYEPEQLLPALRAFGEGRDSVFLFVFYSDDQRTRVPIGFFPLERRKSFRGFPANLLTAWQHPHAFLNTPLLDARFAREAWQAACTWARTDPRGGSLLEFPILLGEGPSYRALIDAVHRESWITYTADHFTRAALHPKTKDGDAHLEAALSTGKRKELRRQRRRLSDQGNLETRTLERDGDLEQWIELFLKLEAAGWKGEACSALLRDEAEASYFRSVCRALFARDRLNMLGLFLGETPIAMKCNFRSGDGSFAIKIAYDEAYAKFSPGVLLEIENVLDAHRRPGLCWMDSCAAPQHPMIDWLWTDRRSIQHILISPGSRRGNLLLALFGLLRAIKRSFSRTPNLGASHDDHDESDQAQR